MMNPYEVLYIELEKEQSKCLSAKRALGEYLEEINIPERKKIEIFDIVDGLICDCSKKAFYTGIDVAKRFLMK